MRCEPPHICFRSSDTRAYSCYQIDDAGISLRVAQGSWKLGASVGENSSALAANDVTFFFPETCVAEVCRSLKKGVGLDWVMLELK